MIIFCRKKFFYSKIIFFLILLKKHFPIPGMLKFHYIRYIWKKNFFRKIRYKNQFEGWKRGFRGVPSRSLGGAVPRRSRVSTEGVTRGSDGYWTSLGTPRRYAIVPLLTPFHPFPTLFGTPLWNPLGTPFLTYTQD